MPEDNAVAVLDAAGSLHSTGSFYAAGAFNAAGLSTPSNTARRAAFWLGSAARPRERQPAHGTAPRAPAGPAPCSARRSTRPSATAAESSAPLESTQEPRSDP